MEAPTVVSAECSDDVQQGRARTASAPRARPAVFDLTAEDSDGDLDDHDPFGFSDVQKNRHRNSFHDGTAARNDPVAAAAAAVAAQTTTAAAASASVAAATSSAASSRERTVALETEAVSVAGSQVTSAEQARNDVQLPNKTTTACAALGAAGGLIFTAPIAAGASAAYAAGVMAAATGAISGAYVAQQPGKVGDAARSAGSFASTGAETAVGTATDAASAARRAAEQAAIKTHEISRRAAERMTTGTPRPSVRPQEPAKFDPPLGIRVAAGVAAGAVGFASRLSAAGTSFTDNFTAGIGVAKEKARASIDAASAATVVAA